MKRWKNPEKPTLLFTTGHKGDVGGGGIWAHQIAKILESMTEFRYLGQPPSIDFKRNHRFNHVFPITMFELESDIFVAHNHFVIANPIGKSRNILLVMFPKKEHKEKVKGYDTVITCSQFGADYVKEYWNKKAIAVYPSIDTDFFEFQPRKPKTIHIVNVARFFREENGQSKNQHVLIEAFQDVYGKSQMDKSIQLHLAGSVTCQEDHNYLQECKLLASGLPITFHKNATIKELRDLYRKSSIYWHANGYGRKDPIETEHFGISIAEAMSCGAIPIVFNGGAAFRGEFGDISVWNDPKTLVKETFNHINLPSLKGISMMHRRTVIENFNLRQMKMKLRKELFV